MRNAMTKRRNRIRALLLAGALLPLAAFAQEEQPAQIETSKTFGAYEVLYTVFPSTTLLPQMAAEYNVVRAGDQALVNISVRRHLSDGTDVAQPAKLQGTYTNLIQPKNLEFREVREKDAIYYLAQLRFTDRELLRFDIKVMPAVADGEPVPVGAPFPISFTRKFFVEK